MLLAPGLECIWYATANPLHLLEMVLPSKMVLGSCFGRVVFGRCFCLLVLGPRVLYLQGISTAPGSGSAQAPWTTVMGLLAPRSFPLTGPVG